MIPNPVECFRHPGTGLPVPGSQQAPAFVAIPYDSFGISGMTPPGE